MANTKDIRSRIASVKNTQQTTKAMKLVSAAKFRRAQTAILNARPYAKQIQALIRRVAETGRVEHFLFGKREEVKNVLLVVLTSDRGLCGGFNSSIIKYTNGFVQDCKDKYEKIDFLFVGRRGADFFVKRGVQPKDVILNLAKEVHYNMAAEVARELTMIFQDGQYDEIRLIYNEFKSALQANVVNEVLLPIEFNESPSSDFSVATYSKDFIFEPAAGGMVDVLLKKHFAGQVYRCMLESLAAEHSSRMNAMENASKNAGEMIRNLTLHYNKVRQAAITTELTEIVSGSEALKG